MAFNIDLNRGVTECRHPTGLRIFMYDDDPGVYIDVNAGPVDEQLALVAGYNVKKYAEMKRLDSDVAVLEQAKKALVTDGVRELMETRGNYALVKVGGGFVVESGGKPVGQPPYSEDIARQTFLQLAGPPAKASKAAA